MAGFCYDGRRWTTSGYARSSVAVGRCTRSKTHVSGDTDREAMRQQRTDQSIPDGRCTLLGTCGCEQSR